MTEPSEIFVLGKRVRLLQPAEGFRTGLDSVMLAAACPVQAGESVLDLGCGVSGAGLCVLHRIPEARLTGIDIQPDHIELARHNAAANGMEENAEFFRHDVREFRPEERFDHVICNPPYLEDGTHTPSPRPAKAVAHGHYDEDTELDDWIDTAFHTVKSRGSFTIIHRADHTDKIIKSMGKRFGAVEIIPLWPRAGVQAKRVVIRAVKDRKSPAILHAGLVLHEENGDYTKEAEKILRAAFPLLSQEKLSHET